MIEIKSVSKQYDDVKAVNELSINIEKGNFFGLRGPNGAGKTTLIKMIIGLLDVDEGEILIEGENLTRDSLDIKRKIGVVSQHVNLDKEISVYENMYFSGLLYKLEKKLIKQRISEILGFS